MGESRNAAGRKPPGDVFAILAFRESPGVILFTECPVDGSGHFDRVEPGSELHPLDKTIIQFRGVELGLEHGPERAEVGNVVLDVLHLLRGGRKGPIRSAE
jgi:hypothetical protein